MDSFLEEPRKTPKPTPVIQEIGTPTVPEVSLMFQNTRRDMIPANRKIGKTMQSYNAWKLRSSPNNNAEFDSFVMTNMNLSNKENVSNMQQMLEDKSLLSKKQVRFESPVQKTSPVLQYPSRQNVLISKMKNIPEPSLDKFSDLVHRNDTFGNNRPVASNDNKMFTQQIAATKPFEKLYVSNIPNRELDLSCLEPAKNPCNFMRTDVRSGLQSPVSRVDHNTKTYSKNTAAPVFLNNSLTRGMNTPNRTSGRIGYYNNPDMLHTPLTLQSDHLVRNTTTMPFQNIVSEVKRNTMSKEKQVVDSEMPVIRIEEEIMPDQTNLVPSEMNPNNDNTNTNIDNGGTEQNTPNTPPSSSTSDNPSMKDLLQIIKLQNEQLQTLQNQVDKLVKLNLKAAEVEVENKRQIRTPQAEGNVTFKDQQVETSFVEDCERKVTIREESIEHKNNNKISMGVMTSFEVSFKPPMAKKKPKIRNMQPVNDVSINDVSFYETIRHHRGKSRRKPEVVKRTRNEVQPNHLRVFPESWKRTNETEYSLGSQEFLDVQEPPASPENSIHIDMHEYDTDSDDEYESMEPGWTFCQDMVGQLNNMRQNTDPANPDDYRANTKTKYMDTQMPDTTMHCIKQATLQHLQQDGFTQSNGADGPLQSNDISFAVKQLLMKYLPDDGLANVATRNKTEQHQQPPYKKPTDVSVATFKYTQQYNVVTNNSPPYHGHKQKAKQTKRSSSQRNTVDPKILDITTIKQQPKLL